MTKDPNEWLTVQDVAKELERSPKSITRSIRSGYLTAEKFGRQWRILRHDLDEYLNNPPRPGPKPADMQPPGE